MAGRLSRHVVLLLGLLAAAGALLAWQRATRISEGA
jgi:hypothetical protein